MLKSWGDLGELVLVSVELPLFFFGISLMILDLALIMLESPSRDDVAGIGIGSCGVGFDSRGVCFDLNGIGFDVD